MNQPDYPEDQGGNCRGSRNSQDPRPHNSSRDAPAYRREPMDCANSDNRSGDGVRRAHWDTSKGSAEQSQRASAFGTKSSDRFQLGDLGAHGVNDAPTPEISAQGDGSVSCKNDWPLESAPVVGHVVRSHVTRGKERARHNSHGFLGVVATMADAVSCGGNELEPAEPVVNRAGILMLQKPIAGDGKDES